MSTVNAHITKKREQNWNSWTLETGAIPAPLRIK